MKIKIVSFLLLIAILYVLSGCGNENKPLKKDAKAIAGIMCKSIEAMKNLKTADPSDSILVGRLQSEYTEVQAEMANLYKEFRSKYEKKVDDPEFTKEFRKYLNESMLDCKSLSKEDREVFEKEIKP